MEHSLEFYFLISCVFFWRYVTSGCPFLIRPFAHQLKQWHIAKLPINNVAFGGSAKISHRFHSP